MERAHFLVTQAFEEDEKGNGDEAIELYTQAVELCIKTVYHIFFTHGETFNLVITLLKCLFVLFLPLS